jgi:SAM-dependent methyltransferase
MSLSCQYKRQFGWRDWASVLKELPPLHGQTVIDLGCGVGDLAAEFVARGARVIGCDINEEFPREGFRLSRGPKLLPKHTQPTTKDIDHARPRIRFV